MDFEGVCSANNHGCQSNSLQRFHSFLPSARKHDRRPYDIQIRPHQQQRPEKSRMTPGVYCPWPQGQCLWPDHLAQSTGEWNLPIHPLLFLRVPLAGSRKARHHPDIKPGLACTKTVICIPDGMPKHRIQRADNSHYGCRNQDTVSIHRIALNCHRTGQYETELERTPYTVSYTPSIRGYPAAELRFGRADDDTIFSCLFA